jgi:hypothetical protein
MLDNNVIDEPQIKIDKKMIDFARYFIVTNFKLLNNVIHFYAKRVGNYLASVGVVIPYNTIHQPRYSIIA